MYDKNKVLFSCFHLCIWTLKVASSTNLALSHMPGTPIYFFLLSSPLFLLLPHYPISLPLFLSFFGAED